MQIALITGGTVVNIIESTLEFAQTLSYDDAVVATTDACLRATYVDGVFAPPAAEPEEPNKLPLSYGTRITPLAFIDRWTPEEEVAIRTAAKTSVEVESLIARVQLATFIDLADPRTVAGINALVAANLLTAERATAILTDPVQPAEVPA